jgi:hypothetical protein
MVATLDAPGLQSHAPSVTSSTTEQFSGLLAKGLGRAHLVLKAGPPSAATKQALISACLANVAYDRQIEDSRATYLHELVKLAGITERAAAVLIQSLNDVNAEEAAIAQRWELAGLLAGEGVAGIRDAMSPALEQLAEHWAGEPGNADPPREPARQLVLHVVSAGPCSRSRNSAASPAPIRASGTQANFSTKLGQWLDPNSSQRLPMLAARIRTSMPTFGLSRLILRLPRMLPRDAKSTNVRVSG